MDAARVISNFLIAVDVLVVLGLVAALTGVALTAVRRARPECVWMVIGAAALELFSVVLMQGISPLLIQSIEDRIAGDPSIAILIPSVFSLVSDLIQGLAVLLLMLAIVRLARGGVARPSEG